MRLIIPISLLFIFLLGESSLLANPAPKDSTKHVVSPYKKENNPWFQLGTFKRGFSNDSLKLTLDSLEKKSRRTWTRTDSLVFASTSLKTGNTALADYYFDHLHVDFNSEEKFWYDHLMIYMVNNEFSNGLNLIKSASPVIHEYSKLDFLRKIFIAKKEHQVDPKWHRDHNILGWHADSALINLDRDSEEYQERVIQPLQNLSDVLTMLIHYIHEDDHIIADCCHEMGLILEQHVSKTQAYIAFSLGKHYNKFDGDLSDDIKRIKGLMMSEKLRIPIFRKHFPRIEYWRFDYEVLKEKVISERNDTLEKFKPDIIQPVEEDESLVNFPLEYITIGGLFIIFICILLFLKTKKKH